MSYEEATTICDKLLEDMLYDVPEEYNVDTCVFGHLHSHSHKTAVVGDVEGVNMKLVAGDFVDFTPILV